MDVATGVADGESESVCQAVYHEFVKEHRQVACPTLEALGCRFLVGRLLVLGDTVAAVGTASPADQVWVTVPLVTSGPKSWA